MKTLTHPLEDPHIVITEEEWHIIGANLELTPRQLDIVQAILAGTTKPQAIGLSLGIKPSSVVEQIERMYRKLAIHSKVELVVRVLAELIRLRCDEMLVRKSSDTRDLR